MSGSAHGVFVLAGALAFDLLVGEPPNALHPVVWMGTLQQRLRGWAPRSPAAAFCYGLVMALAGPLVFGGGAWALLRALAPFPWAQIAVEIYLLKSAFAVRALASAASRVARSLAAGDLAGARQGLRSLVSRDTSELTAPLLAAAAIESVAENASDSIVAPLTYYLIGGLIGGVPAALAYRAANTLDSMIGYHGETEWLGKAAARLDDALNLIPARVTALFITVAALLVGASPGGALRVWKRDGASTESPNAGRPMAAMAGALGVELEKRAHYKLGAGGRAATGDDIGRANFILTAVAAMTWLVVFATVVARAS